jgi:hypothetical protein
MDGWMDGWIKLYPHTHIKNPFVFEKEASFVLISASSLSP